MKASHKLAENVFLKYYAANFIFFLLTDHGDKRHIVQTVDKNPLELQKRSIYLTLAKLCGEIVGHVTES